MIWVISNASKCLQFKASNKLWDSLVLGETKLSSSKFKPHNSQILNFQIITFFWEHIQNASQASSFNNNLSYASKKIQVQNPISLRISKPKILLSSLHKTYTSHQISTKLKLGTIKLLCVVFYVLQNAWHMDLVVFEKSIYKFCCWPSNCMT